MKFQNSCVYRFKKNEEFFFIIDNFLVPFFMSMSQLSIIYFHKRSIYNSLHFSSCSFPGSKFSCYLKCSYFSVGKINSMRINIYSLIKSRNLMVNLYVKWMQILWSRFWCNFIFRAANWSCHSISSVVRLDAALKNTSETLGPFAKTIHFEI